MVQQLIGCEQMLYRTSRQAIGQKTIALSCGVEGPCDSLVLLLETPDVVLDLFGGSLCHHHLCI